MSEAYKSSAKAGRAPRRRAVAPGTPAPARELRAQGRKTMRQLLDAGMRVFAERGFHAARVDDIVRAARTSHGTFYLYFANKEDLLRALAVECAHEMGALADALGAGRARRGGLRRAAPLPRPFFTTYRALRAGHPRLDGRPRRRPRGRARSACARSPTSRTALGRAHPRGRRRVDDAATVAALMALLERFAYFLVSRRLEFDNDATARHGHAHRAPRLLRRAARARNAASRAHCG